MSAPGPDGLPVPPSGVSRVPPRPRLCEQGPCRHYHRLTIQVDAESPRAVKTPVRLPVVSHMATEASDGGTLYQAPRTFHTEVQHYCYPDTGIETTLGSTPVVECNRWSPDPEADDAAERARGIFLSSRRGQRYLADLKAWEDAREAEAAEAEEIERTLADAERERSVDVDVLVNNEMAELDMSEAFRVNRAGKNFVATVDLPEAIARVMQDRYWPASAYASSEARSLEVIRAAVRESLVWMAANGQLPMKKGSENE